MAERKPNNLPWIILGVIGGAALLALFGFGVYAGAKSVQSEMTVSVPEFEDRQPLAREKTVHINVDAQDTLHVDGILIEKFDAFEEAVKSEGLGAVSSTLIVLHIHEEAKHKTLVDLKDLLDGMGYRSLIEVVSNDSDLTEE